MLGQNGPIDGRDELVRVLDSRMREFNSQVVMFSRAVAVKLGINATDLQCLNVLVQEGPIAAGRLAEITGLTVQASPWKHYTYPYLPRMESWPRVSACGMLVNLCGCRLRSIAEAF